MKLNNSSAGFVLVLAALFLMSTHAGARAAEPSQRAPTKAEAKCIAGGWRRISLVSAGIQRQLLWREPDRIWRNGTIVVLHGGGGSAADFCSGGLLVKPQIRFAQQAIERGFAVFILESTDDKVTDSAGRACGKRFDFSVLDRPNLDLPYIGEVIDEIVPQQRPTGSAPSVFMTGLSAGGYMTIRAATHFDDRVTAFAPISAGDPYGTHSNCDPALSPRKSAKGILLDNETGKQITEDDACRSSTYARESRWGSAGAGQKPPFRQFHHREDGIVDLSCMEKAGELLRKHGYPYQGAFLLGNAGKKRIWKHLWQDEYNTALLDFFTEVNSSSNLRR